jgi:hypothetical protein
LPARAILALANQAAQPKRMTETTYAAEAGLVNHYAEKEADFAIPDVEYEHGRFF